jgi:hypothetical protein
MDRKDFRLIERKRFVSFRTHPNFCFAKTFFVLEVLNKMSALTLRRRNKLW